MKKGWARLHRCIEDWDLYFSEPFTKTQAWIDLFLGANHKDGSIHIRGNVVDIKRGQIGWSELTMVKRWKWSKNKVRRFLKWLETEQQITQQKDRYITTIITILNYENYQKDTADDTAERQQKVQQTIHKQEVKNVKKKRTPQKKTPSQFTISDETRGKLERDYGVEVIEKYSETVRDYCSAKGVTYKDYAAAVRNFMRRDGVEKIKTTQEQLEKDFKII